MKHQDNSTFLNDILSNMFIILMTVLFLLLTMTHQGALAKQKDDTNTTNIESANPKSEEGAIINPIFYQIEHPDCIVKIDINKKDDESKLVSWSQYDKSETDNTRVGEFRFRPSKKKNTIKLDFSHCNLVSSIKIVKTLKYFF